MLVVLVVASYRKKAKIRKERKFEIIFCLSLRKLMIPIKTLTHQGQEKGRGTSRCLKLLIMTFSIKIPIAHVRQEMGISKKD